jgi:hypothetical protein
MLTFEKDGRREEYGSVAPLGLAGFRRRGSSFESGNG